MELIQWLHDLHIDDVPQVGGKNASLGEMIGALSSEDIRVPGGFATTADAYREFLTSNNLDQKIHDTLDKLDVDDVKALGKIGKQVRQWVVDAPFSPEFEQSIKDAYTQLVKEYGEQASFAVRSSATAEDLPEASFAGQQETFLNISGIDNLLSAIKEVFASLYNDRAIAYRVHQGFDHRQVALSAGIQKMVRSDVASSGVFFTIYT